MKNYDENLSRLWKNKYKILLVFFVFLIINFIFIFVILKRDNKALEEFRKRYRYIEKADKFNGEVDSVNCFKGASEISLTNGDEFFLSTSRNYDYEIFLMCCFINIGDFLLKESNNDTVFVLKGDSKYYFVHGEFIGEKQDSRFYSVPCR